LTNIELVFATARNLAIKARKEGKPITPEFLRGSAAKANLILELEMSPSELEEAFKLLETSLSVMMLDTEKIMTAQDDHKPWLEDSRQGESWQFWERYSHHLLSTGFPEMVVEGLDRVTDKILGLTGNPRQSSNFDRRGLVVGHVQSGKTANYTGLVCKAADAGYKMIIVLAGLHNNLRSQTQVRLEEGFLGYMKVQSKDKAKEFQKVAVGVGLSGVHELLPANTMTTRREKGDFSKVLARQFSVTPEMIPWLFVIKKNVPVLRNLLLWLKGFVPDHLPALVVDDEADNASIDTKEQKFDEDEQPDPDHEPTKVNAYIRKILLHFKKRSYVGYTATPFANIFIHHEAETKDAGPDLFPRDFIISLPTADNYVGPTRVFGLSAPIGDETETIQPLPLIHQVQDSEDWMPPGHKPDHVPKHDGREQLPPSLRKAVLSFLITIACRRLRKPNSINSMLVHVTQFIKVQRDVYDQLDSLLRQVKRELGLGSAQVKSGIVQELKDLFEADYLAKWPKLEAAGVPVQLHRWDEVFPKLVESVAKVELKQINGSAADVLDYAEAEEEGRGLDVIAVGGNKLSRGLTLEGLSVSYFLRPSKMYDSLMQMGRWFGYRPGYLDLCRLYTPKGLVEWFEHITAASQELREDFVRMIETGQTPLEYGHRVLSHPSLMVTSTAKMRHGEELSISFSEKVKETITFDLTGSEIANKTAVEQLVQGLPEPEPARQLSAGGITVSWQTAWTWGQVSGDRIIGFLRTFTTSKRAISVQSKVLSDYLETQLKNGELQHWTIALIGGEDQKMATLSGLKIPRALRKEKEPKAKGVYRIGRLLSAKDEAIDLTPEQFAKAVEEWRAGDAKSSDSTARPSGTWYRKQRKKECGLLILYPLMSDDPEKTKEVVWGFGISFPNSPNARAVTYQVNTKYLEEL